MDSDKTLGIVLEQHFVVFEGGVYTDVQCDQSFWDRYLGVFDRVVVCARMRGAREGDDAGKLLLSSRPEIQFIGMPDFVGVAGLLKNLSLVREAVDECIERSDAIVARVPSPISLAIYSQLRASNKPWAAEMMMNPATAYGKESMRHPLQPIIQGYAVERTRRMCMNANGVAYVTERVLQADYPCRAMKEIDDPSFFTASYSTINLDPGCFVKKNLPSAAPSQVCLAHTGKMSDDRKGHEEFLLTIVKLRNAGIDARGILIGDGPQRGHFQELADSLGVADCCEFAGWVSGFSEVQRRLHQAEFFVAPTKSEGLPRSVIEAMASGLICIGHAVDGIPELLEEGCLSHTNDPSDYARMIVGFLDDWPWALRTRDGQFEKAQEYCSDVLNVRRAEFYSKLRRCSS